VIGRTLQIVQEPSETRTFQRILATAPTLRNPNLRHEFTVAHTTRAGILFRNHILIKPRADPGTARLNAFLVCTRAVDILDSGTSAAQLPFERDFKLPGSISELNQRSSMLCDPVQIDA